MLISSRRPIAPVSRKRSSAHSAPPVESSGAQNPEVPTWIPPSRAAMMSVAQPTRAVPADDYSDKFRRKEGWTGADGSYSVTLPDGSTLWLFSDTFLGSVGQDGARSPDVAFVNNTLAHQTGPEQLSFHHGGSKGSPEAVFQPPDGKGWFWQHDAQVTKEGRIQVFLAQFDRSGDGGPLGFEAIGNWLGELEMGPEGPKVTSYTKIPHFQKAEAGEPAVLYGTATLQDQDWLYLYGVRDYGANKESVLARVKPEQLQKSEEWEFFNGSSWSSDMNQAAPIADNVAVEHSVHRTASGQYVMVSQKGGAGPEVQVRRAPRPEGPWGEAETVWRAPENQGLDLTYNAKAHPELSDERGLLISYNVNSVDWDRNLQVADIYRPRFIRVPDPTLLP